MKYLFLLLLASCAYAPPEPTICNNVVPAPPPPDNNHPIGDTWRDDSLGTCFQANKDRYVCTGMIEGRLGTLVPNGKENDLPWDFLEKEGVAKVYASYLWHEGAWCAYLGPTEGGDIDINKAICTGLDL